MYKTQSSAFKQKIITHRG